MPSATSIVRILWRYKNHEDLSEAELTELRKWLEESRLHEDLFDELSNNSKWEKEINSVSSGDSEATWNKIQLRVTALSEKNIVKRIPWLKYSMAAASIVFFGILMTFWFNRKNQKPNPGSVQSVKKSEIYPSSGYATLLLEDGQIIKLDSAPTGTIEVQAGARILKTDSAALSYSSVSGSSAEIKYNTLSTGRGSQFKLSLPDGSVVWLNSGSVIRYPVEFSGNTRPVELKGEAYFEITKNKEKPFIVQVNQTEVRVLGTRFDVKAYEGELLSTALVEGSVRLRRGTDSIQIEPGQLVRNSNHGSFIVDSANLQQVLAWRSHLFWFSQTPLKEIMSDISRQYDVDISYEGSLENSFTGILPQNLPLSGLLAMIEKGGNVHFSRDGNKVIVRP